ncbi:MAG: xanthine dehydrogenase family protein molybdopterin-binding subunit, partial [Anaerolineae bacterium]
GMGVTTTLAQIAAEALGIDLSRIKMATVDTVTAPNAGSSSASRQTYVSGNAVLAACRKAKEKWLEVLRAESGKNRVRAEHLFRTQDVHPTTLFDPETGQCDPHVTYGYATQIAEVEVDVETGQVDVLKICAAHDVGRAINPQGVLGQIGGGVHMGIGYALTEEFVQQDGVIQTHNLTEYLVPTTLDMPVEIKPIIVEVADPNGPYGAKGVGEMTTLPTAPAILNAIHDAVGVRIHHLPATPARVRQGLIRLEKHSCRNNIPIAS